MYVARDKDGSLWLFEEKPYKSDYVWLSSLGIGVQFRINEKLFPLVKWSDTEPRELILKPIKENSDVTNIHTPFQYSEENRLKWYTDKKGRTALCFTCAYDGYCSKPMRYTKCKDYIERKE